MKNERFKVVGYVLMAGLLILTGLSRAEASTYLGEYCWNQSVSVGGQIEGNVRLAVTDMGGSHYIVNGNSTNTSTPAVAAIHGNAEIVGNKVILTLASSHTDQFGTSMSTTNFNLDISSLNGTFRSISQDYSSGARAFEPLDHTEGAVTITPCK